LAAASSGIEPLFALAYVRNVMDDDKLVEVHPYFKSVLERRGLYSKELMEKVAKLGTPAHIKEIPANIKKAFATAHDVSPIWHIKMQAAFQKHTDNAVSKTVNFRNGATIDEVKEAYELAYKLGCKGLTIYRDGSRDNQDLSVGANDKDKTTEIKEALVETKEKPVEIKEKTQARQRPEVTMGITEKVRVGCGNLYITVNYDENGICEVFTNVGKAGGCPSQSEATSRLISVGLRGGMDVDEIIEQLKGIRCHSTLRQKSNKNDIKVLSCPDAIARTIEKIKKMNQFTGIKVGDIESLIEEVPSSKEKLYHGTCPECGAEITHQDGCVICPNCGFSKCG
jgi:ribonucleoside-diphosphate reductase alpha chain